MPPREHKAVGRAKIESLTLLKKTDSHDLCRPWPSALGLASVGESPPESGSFAMLREHGQERLSEEQLGVMDSADGQLIMNV